LLDESASGSALRFLLGAFLVSDLAPFLDSFFVYF
jgi:hypothetical protein